MKKIKVTVIGHTHDEDMSDLTIFHMEGVKGQKCERTDRFEDMLYDIFENGRSERELLDICEVAYQVTQEEQLDIFTGGTKTVQMLRFENGKMAYFQNHMVSFEIVESKEIPVIEEEIPRGFVFGQSWKRTLV